MSKGLQRKERAEKLHPKPLLFRASNWRWHCVDKHGGGMGDSHREAWMNWHFSKNLSVFRTKQ